MELAFALTPGLSVFMSLDTASLVAASTDVTLFYSVTVLSLLGHVPFAAFVGLGLVQRQVADVENSVTFAALLWLFLSLASVGMMIALIVTKVSFIVHAIVVVSLILGSLLRLSLIVAVPYAFFANGDPMFNVAWWWLVCGIDWPDLPVTLSFIPELLSILVVAQAVHRTSWSGQVNGIVAVMITPMLLRATSLSDTLLFRVILPFFALVFLIYSLLTVGFACDLNRVLTGWSTSPIVYDDIEKGE